MPEIDIGLGGDKFNFDQSFLKLNVKKIIYAKNSFWLDLKSWILDSASLSN